MAHLALTDVAAGRFHAFERFERGALGLAGARAESFAVWTGPWIAEGVGAGTFPMRLLAVQDDVALDLVVEPAKELLLQGEHGLSQKGAAPGNASYYYSYTRLATRGRLRTAAGEHAVEGSSWLDREWSTSALEQGQVGWDWFALQLDDGRELMLYQLRGQDGSPSPESAGTLVAADGSSRALAPRLLDRPARALDEPRLGRRVPRALARAGRERRAGARGARGPAPAGARPRRALLGGRRRRRRQPHRPRLRRADRLLGPGGPRQRPASAARAARRPSSTSTRESSRAPTAKKTSTESRPARLEPVRALASQKKPGPATPANFSRIENRPKNSPERWRGIRLA